MNFFDMREHDIHELDRELEGGKSVWVKGEYGAEYKVKYEEGIYYVECEGGRYTEKFDDIYEMKEYINFNFEEDEEDEGIEAISKILSNYKG
ncbi:hypothetical protein LQJ84_001157 [Campylobacter upsaliensis]|nr:hypothetical protein [Campylobacter upsaliensis]EIS1949696.1 hypothetical protein [Campylobacter upsaliensis]